MASDPDRLRSPSSPGGGPEQQAALLLGSEDEERGLSAHIASPTGRRFLPAVILGSVLAASAVTALSMRGRSLRKTAAAEALQVKASLEDFPSLCGKMEADTEYVFEEADAWGTNFDHIPTAEMCCAMCQGEPKCKAFTWVKDAGLDGCPSQCWLKGGVGTPRPAEGLVSGVPPQRLAVDEIPKGEGSSGSSLYCTALMVPGSYEEDMLLWQYNNKASLFACNAAEVFSNQTIQVAPGLTTSAINSTLKCEYGGDSGTALNAWVFIEFWRKVIENKEYAKHDWTVKVDPDAVFFPDRLLNVVKDHTSDAYINNCKYGLHGPIEVLGTVALAKLAEEYHASFDGKAPKRCVEEMDFGLWGEDMFIDQCLQLLEVGTSPVDDRVMCEDHCECPAWYWCQNGTDRVSFHPFKTVFSYKNCMANAMGGSPLPEGAEEDEEDYTPAPRPAPASDGPSPSSEEDDDGNDGDDNSDSVASGYASEDSEDSGEQDTGEQDSNDYEEHAAPRPTESQADFYADASAADYAGEGGGGGSCAEYGCSESYRNGDSCQCNPECKHYDSCCQDFADECSGTDEGSAAYGGSVASSASADASTLEDSCSADGCHVAYSSSRTCQCNSKCADFGNCCPDYADTCQ